MVLLDINATAILIPQNYAPLYMLMVITCKTLMFFLYNHVSLTWYKLELDNSMGIRVLHSYNDPHFIGKAKISLKLDQCH